MEVPPSDKDGLYLEVDKDGNHILRDCDGRLYTGAREIVTPWHNTHQDINPFKPLTRMSEITHYLLEQARHERVGVDGGIDNLFKEINEFIKN